MVEMVAREKESSNLLVPLYFMQQPIIPSETEDEVHLYIYG